MVRPSDFLWTPIPPRFSKKSNEDSLKCENNLKNEDDLKNEENLKNEDNENFNKLELSLG